MKKYYKAMLSSMLLLLVAMAAKAQGATTPFGIYRWVNEVVITPCGVDGENTGDREITSIAGQLFSVVRKMKDEDTYIIKILNYKDNNGTNNGFIATYNFANPALIKATKPEQAVAQKYFKVSADILAAGAVKVEWEKGSLVAGAISLPFKFRLQGGDFSGNFNIGAAGGLRFRHRSTKTALSLLVAASVSTITLDSASINYNKLDVLKTNSFSALTLCVGGMAELGKVQVGIFIGSDWLSRLNNQTFGWRYQGKPWISFGIGYAIFGAEKKDNDPKETNK